MKKNVLITGAAGFLGSHLCDYFLNKNYKVIGVDNLITGNLKNISEIGNRKLAIKKAISELKRGDLLLIAGKGHEKFQSIMGKKFPFDDVKIAEKYLQKK